MPSDGMLLIDLGNSSLKAAMLQQGGLGPIERLAYAGADLVDVAESLAAQRTAPAAVSLASVLPAVLTDMFRKTLARRWACPIRLVRTQSEAHGVRIAYADANRLGVDRWLALIAAHREHQGDVVIADLGSALTVDVLRADGEHLGGVIAPGFAAMFAGLSASTRFPPQPRLSPITTILGGIPGRAFRRGCCSRRSVRSAKWCDSRGNGMDCDRGCCSRAATRQELPGGWPKRWTGSRSSGSTTSSCAASRSPQRGEPLSVGCGPRCAVAVPAPWVLVPRASNRWPDPPDSTARPRSGSAARSDDRPPRSCGGPGGCDLRTG